MLITCIAPLAVLLSITWAAPTKPEGCRYGICDTSLLSKRAVCNADNLLRNLRDKRYSLDASAFCSVYIQSTAVTTVGVVVTKTDTATFTPSPILVTQVVTVPTTEVSTITSTSYSTAVNTLRKRDVPYPPFLATTYPPSRVSSACSCFVTPSPPVTKSTTVTTGTETLGETVTLPTVTVTATSTTTSIDSQVTTVVVPGGPILCGVQGCTNGAGFIRLFFNQASNPQECRALCASESGCKSFQFGIETSLSLTVCNLFSVSVEQTFETGSGTDASCQVYSIFDVRCTA
ncbi:MAG: hypothetical protein M1833_000970 [Piccolia ochrophora]|nr:MAG: hypothetical protein M1833_000970 [Piccolia ochrophora]